MPRIWSAVQRKWGRPRTPAVSAVLGGLVVACSLISACSSSSAHSSSSSSSSSQSITIGYLQPPDSLDPAIGVAGQDYPYLFLIFARLINFNPTTGALEPGLASSWKFTGPNNLQFVMTIAKGNKFQDGTPVNGAAVKASLEHFLTGLNSPVLSSVKSISVPSPYTVVLQLSSPDSALPAEMADRPGMIVSPTALRKYGKNFGSHPVGAGPYAFVSEVSGASVTLKGVGKGAKLGQIIFQIFQSDTALVDAVKTGVVQVALGVQPDDVASLRADKQLQVSVGPSLGFNQILFNTKLTPTSNELVREAFNYALNRTAIANVATAGLGSAAWELVPQGSPYYDAADAPTFPYNVAKARQLMAQAGLSGGTNMTCVVSPGSGYDVTGPIIVQEEAAVGIHVQLRTVSTAEADQEYIVNGQYPCFMATWSGRPDPLLTYSGLLASNAEPNVGKQNLGFDTPLNQANAATNTAARQAIFDQMVQIFIKSAPMAVLYYSPEIVVLAKDVHGYVPNFQGKEDFSSLSLSG